MLLPLMPDSLQFVQFVLCLTIWFGNYDKMKATARENTGEIRETCKKGMSTYPAVAPYPYPVVFINEDGVYGQFLCDTSTDMGGWIVIQRHTDKSVSFDRDWAEYESGFGSLSTDFWIGLETIHLLTAVGECELRVELESNGKTAFAHYASFSIGNRTDNYRLSVGGQYDGTAGDALRNHNNARFSTRDKDNDQMYQHNCALKNEGGWWYHKNYCDNANLNTLLGAYDPGVEWGDFIDYKNLASSTEMKIRRRIIPSD